MIWLIVAAGGTGVLLGLFALRVYAVVAASIAVAVLCAAIAPLAQWSFWLAVALTFAAVSALQCGYLAGVALSLRVHANKAEQTIFKSSHIDQ